MEDLAQKMMRYCVINLKKPGPCGATAVHLAFLLEQHALAKRMICTAARFSLFDAILYPDRVEGKRSKPKCMPAKLLFHGKDRECQGKDSPGRFRADISLELDVELVMISDHSSVCQLAKSGILLLRNMRGENICEMDLLPDSEDICKIDLVPNIPSAVARPAHKMVKVGSEGTFLFGETGAGGTWREDVTLRLNKPLVIHDSAVVLRHQSDGFSALTLRLSGYKRNGREATSEDHRDALMFWKQLKTVVNTNEMQVGFTAKMAEIINTAYSSDLDLWILEC